jgi:hypothetical protein
MLPCDVFGISIDTAEAILLALTCAPRFTCNAFTTV